MSYADKEEENGGRQILTMLKEKLINFIFLGNFFPQNIGSAWK